MSKLIVPANREQAAKELKNNMVILKGCSVEVKEVIALALKHGCLKIWVYDGVKCDGNVNEIYSHGAYCLPDDCDIIVQEEKPVVPQWIKDGFVVCGIMTTGSKDCIINYPDTTYTVNYGFPAALRCEGWVFKGWLHKHLDYAICLPLVFKDVNCIDYDEQNWTTMNKANRPVESSTAYASVWQKVGK